MLERPQVHLQQTYRLLSSRLRRTRRKPKGDARAEQRKELLAEQPSGRSREMSAEVRLLERPSVRCAGEENRAWRTSNPRNRRLSRRAHKHNSKPIEPRPLIIAGWLP